MSEIKVNSIKGVGASAAAITVNNTDGSCAVNNTQRQGKNLIINGAMQVAQRGTSSTTSGYGDVDRWQHEYAGTDEAPTFAQVEVVSSDSGDNPFAKGFSNCARITNGNQTSGLQAGSQINFMQPIEAQNIRNSGWNYNSSSSYITLSYYVKASVAQEYHGFVKTADGSNYVYPFSLGSLSANTWTKITKTIPGNSNLQIDNNTGAGFQVWPVALYGTDYTNNSITENAWAAWASGNRSHDQTSTWWTTNDATFEITGVQLEVGSVATDFEHRSYGDELARCQRYYARFGANAGGPGLHFSQGELYGQGAVDNDGNNVVVQMYFPQTLRAEPTAVEQFGSADRYQVRRDTTQTCTSVPTFNSATVYSASLTFTKSSHGWGTGEVANGLSAGSDSYLGFSAEL